MIPEVPLATAKAGRITGGEVRRKRRKEFIEMQGKRTARAMDNEKWWVEEGGGQSEMRKEV